MITSDTAIRAARGLIGTAYSELDCINLIKKVIRTCAGGDKRYTTAGTNALWDSDSKRGRYRDLTWKQASISGAKPGMLAFMGVGTGDVSHTGLVTERGTVIHSSKSWGGVVETALTEKAGWNGLGVHRMIEVNGYVNDEDVQIDAKYSIGEYNKRIAEQEEMTRLTLRGVNALLNHEITGNGIENLKKVRDDITEHLIDK